MIDFAALVIAPALNVFGREIEYRPHGSRAGFPAFRVQAIADNEYVAVEIAEGLIAAGSPQVGVMLSQFAIEPAAEDHVFFPPDIWGGTEWANRLFLVVEPKPDGQGHAKLMLKEIMP